MIVHVTSRLRKLRHDRLLGVLVAFVVLSELAVFFIFSSRPMFLGYDAPNPALPFTAFAGASTIILVFMHLLNRTADKLWVEREKSEAMFSELQAR